MEGSYADGAVMLINRLHASVTTVVHRLDKEESAENIDRKSMATRKAEWWRMPPDS